MKPPGDIGSIVPLNLAQRSEPFVDRIYKSESHDERMWSASRAGTPPTKRGAYNGAMPATLPSVPQHLNPQLYLGKAVINPAEAGGGTRDATPRKRDPATGKFSEAPAAGQQTTAEEDASDSARAAKLSQRRYGTKSITEKAFGDSPTSGDGSNQSSPMLNRPKPPVPAQAPGMGNLAGGSMGTAQAAPGAQPMGQAPDGMPIYDDPYHPEHGQFTPEHHQAAADLHSQQADMATNSGQIPSALDHQLKARIHGDLASDSKSPMERVLSRQGMPGVEQQGGQGMPPSPGAPQPGMGMPPQSNQMQGSGMDSFMNDVGNSGAPPNPNTPQNDSMDNFLTQLPDAQPGQQNMNPDQNKPNLGTSEGNQGPLPRMINTNTGSPVGPQSQSMQHAGTISQPQQMPPDPSDGSSMPTVNGGDPTQIGSEHFLDDGSEEEGSSEDPAEDVPGSNAGGKSGFDLLKEKGEQPTPGNSESEPALDAGPTTNDTNAFSDKEPSAESGPFTGNPLDAKKKEIAEKSFFAWFDNV